MATAIRRELVTSARNPLLKEIRRAAARAELTPGGFAVAESFHLLEEAVRSERPIHAVLASATVRPAVEAHVRGIKGLRVIEVEDGVFDEIAATESSQGVIALVAPPRWTLEELFRGVAMVVVLDGVQDPGNAGAIVRAAEAFGATGVLFVKGTASPFHPKTLRASAGSLFRLPFVHGIDPALARAAMDQKRMNVYAAQPHAGVSLNEADLRGRCALVIGSEGRGISPRLGSGAIDLRIPTTRVESLNAAVAAAVILYEASRQRVER